MKHSIRSLFLACMAVLCFVTAQARAGIFTNDFNVDVGTAVLTGTAVYRSTGGVNDSGYVSITDALASQQGGLILPDIDNGEAIGGFQADFDILIGGGSARPADGIAFVFAPEVDDSTNFGEEGFGSGLTLSFDTWDNDGTDTAPAIDVKVGGTADANIVSTTFLDGQREGGRARPGPIFTDPTTGAPVSLETGSSFTHVTISVKDGLLNVFYKGYHIVKDVVVAFNAVPGRFAFGGRTGGANDNQWIDNLRVETFPRTAPSIASVRPNPYGVIIQIQDSPNSAVDPTTVTGKVDGTAVNATVTKNGDVTTFNYKAAALLAPGSTHDVVLNYKHGSPSVDATSTFTITVPQYKVLPDDAKVIAGEIDTTKRGFIWRVHQSAQSLGNDNQRTEDQLNGLYGDNLADPTQVGAADGPAAPASPTTAPIQFVISSVINMSDIGGENNGNFTPDLQMPGFDGTEHDNVAGEILTALEFPAAGSYVMGVNSDDGFRTTSAKNPRDVFAPIVGEFVGGRGASDTLFYIVVPSPGIFAFRTTWEQGGGGANIEWFSVLDDGTKVLINDDATNPSAIKAYQLQPSALPAWVSKVTPLPGTTGARPDTTVSAQITDGATQVTTASLSINGGAATTGTKSGGVTTVTLPAGGLAANNTVTLNYTENTTPARNTTDTWTFTTLTVTQTLPTTLATAVGSGDATKPGFLVTPYQVDNTSGNTENNNEATESELAGFYAPNIADLTGAVNGVLSIPGYLNWDRTANDGSGGAGDGNFTAANGFPDDPLPGITPSTGGGGATFESVAEGIQTYIEFPTAGFYQLGVNSDDNFRLTIAKTNPPATLTVTGIDGGTTPKGLGALSMSKYAVEVAGRAVYGAQPPASGLTAQIVYMTPGGIDDPGPYPNVTGKIALIDRSGSNLGTTSTGGKCLAAQTAGAIAVIFTTPADPTYGFYAGATRTDINIPCLSIPDSQAQTLKDAIAAGKTLTGTITGDSSYVVGGFNDGRGASDTIMSFNVTQAGVYPMRLIFHQGGGGGNMEFFSIKPDGTKVLVNDTAHGGLKAFQALSGNVVQPAKLTASVSGQNITITWTNGGTLYSAASVAGPWTSTGNTSGTFTTAMSGAMQFFKVQNP
ncbi:MAG TPA: PA domain-containing protein [Pyrinomonadaceae bacterium]